MMPTLSDIGAALSISFGAVGTALILWLRASKTRLSVQENASQGGWLSQLQARAEAAETRANEAEQRERETYAIHVQDQITINRLTARVDRQEKQLALITKLLIDSGHPFASLLSSSGFGDLFNESRK